MADAGLVRSFDVQPATRTGHLIRCFPFDRQGFGMNVAIYEAQLAHWCSFALSAALWLLPAMVLLWMARSVLLRQLSFAWPTPARVLALNYEFARPKRGDQPLRSFVLLPSTPSR